MKKSVPQCRSVQWLNAYLQYVHRPIHSQDLRQNLPPFASKICNTKIRNILKRKNEVINVKLFVILLPFCARNYFLIAVNPAWKATKGYFLNSGSDSHTSLGVSLPVSCPPSNISSIRWALFDVFKKRGGMFRWRKNQRLPCTVWTACLTYVVFSLMQHMYLKNTYAVYPRVLTHSPEECIVSLNILFATIE